MKIVIMDSDVLINLIDYLYVYSKKQFDIVITYLLLHFGKIWIPYIVKQEYKESKRVQKRLDKILKRHQLIEICPIKNNKNEIALEIAKSGIDQGEIDGILQAAKIKAISNPKYYFQSVYFLTNDKKAITAAKNKGIDVIEYKKLKNTMREIGINLVN